MNVSFLYFLVLMLAESIKYTKLRSRTTGSMLCHLYSYLYSFIQYSREPQVDTELVIIITICTVQNES